ncbi:MAG: tetraacyldisaccharide 4'-kinase [Bacteroidetes bacterium]|nr:tetraacyldisaccharide 4'-kinase [Bacteroidota bacterium]
MKKKINIMRLILIPFSLFYSFFMSLRNFLYEMEILSICRSEAKVISVGNITTGGTGKTPMIIFLAKYFLGKGKKVGIISRGYGRKTKEMVIVYDGKIFNRETDQTGDELSLITFELLKDFSGNFFVAASDDRCTSAAFLTGNFNAEIILLDDAFQHRSIYRDLDIVMIDANDMMLNGFLYKFTIPSGNLRENLSGIKRADLIIMNMKDSQQTNPGFNFSSPALKIKYKTEYFIDHKNTILNERKNKAVIFSGLAEPFSFRKAVEKNGIEVTGEIKFRDHHEYSEKDISELISLYKNDLIFITTGKDFIKLRKFKDFIESYPVYYLNLEIDISDKEKLFFENLLG